MSQVLGKGCDKETVGGCNRKMQIFQRFGDGQNVEVIATTGQQNKYSLRCEDVPPMAHREPSARRPFGHGHLCSVHTQVRISSKSVSNPRRVSLAYKGARRVEETGIVAKGIKWFQSVCGPLFGDSEIQSIACALCGRNCRIPSILLQAGTGTGEELLRQTDRGPIRTSRLAAGGE